MASRTLESIVQGQATSDGDGVKLTRVLTQDLQARLDPFLMLDAFRNDNPDDYMGGFPDHPHRGFETVTYMLNGRMRHQDSAGNAGLLQGGGAQWMTAGRGLVHSEMPEQENGLMEGFQLWVNLPGKSKLMAPIYRDLVPGRIPQWLLKGGVTLRGIAGKLSLESSTNSIEAGRAEEGAYAEHFEAAVQRPDTDPIFFDIHFAQAGEVRLSLPAGHNAFIYTYRGEISVGEVGASKAVGDTHMGILSPANGSNDTLRLSTNTASKCILIAGKPLNEPIVQYGPFVMNTKDEIMQAFKDYRAGKIRN